MKHLYPVVALVRGAAAASGERLLGGLYQLLLPGLYLVRVHLEALGEFGQRTVAANGGEGYLRLERRTMGSACASGHGSRRVRLDRNKVATLHLKFPENLSKQSEPPLSTAARGSIALAVTRADGQNSVVFSLQALDVQGRQLRSYRIDRSIDGGAWTPTRDDDGTNAPSGASLGVTYPASGQTEVRLRVYSYRTGQYSPITTYYVAPKTGAGGWKLRIDGVNRQIDGGDTVEMDFRDPGLHEDYSSIGSNHKMDVYALPVLPPPENLEITVDPTGGNANQFTLRVRCNPARWTPGHVTGMYISIYDEDPLELNLDHAGRTSGHGGIADSTVDIERTFTFAYSTVPAGNYYVQVFFSGRVRKNGVTGYGPAATPSEAVQITVPAQGSSTINTYETDDGPVGGATKLLSGQSLDADTLTTLTLAENRDDFELLKLVIGHDNGQEFSLDYRTGRLDDYSSTTVTKNALLAIDTNDSGNYAIYLIDPSDQSVTEHVELTGDIPASGNFEGLGFGGGFIWGVLNGVRTLYKINPSTGATTAIAITGISSSYGIGVNGVAYAEGNVYVTSSRPGVGFRIYRVNPDTGAASSFRSYSSNTASPSFQYGVGLAWTGSLFYLKCNRGNSSGTYLWSLGLIGSPTEIGSYEGVSQTDRGLAWLNDTLYQGDNQWLESVNTSSGAVTGLFGTGVNLHGLTAGSLDVTTAAESVEAHRIAYDPAAPGRKIALWSVAGEDKQINVYPTTDIASLAVYGLKAG